MAKDDIFLKQWKKHYTKILIKMRPDLNKEDLQVFLDNIIKENLVNPKAQLHNNYAHRIIDIDLLALIDWFEEQKPIAGGFGLFFKNQKEALNPNAVMLDNFLKLRKAYKDQLEDFLSGSYEYKTFDRLQSTEKINANSFYGAGGAPTSNFFNIYTATSVTATGQSLISTTEQAFEAFLENNVGFIDLDDCLTFMEKVSKEKYTIDDNFIPNVSLEKLIKHLKKTFITYDESYDSILFEYIMNLPQRMINRIYFKNNIYEFSKLYEIRSRLNECFNKIDEFKNPNVLPKNAESELKELWALYEQFVLYNHFSFGRIERLKNNTRRAVVVVDTDSNMINLDPWVKFLNSHVIDVDNRINHRDSNELRFISINIMCYFLTNMISDVLNKYGKNSNIPKKYRPHINMKNEYLFTRLMLSGKKKRYASSVRLREGKEIYPEKIDIKGMDFIKSTTREDTKEYFTTLIKEKILQKKHINVAEILRDLEAFEHRIRESLYKGEKNFLIPKSVKEVEAYADAFREQGVRGVLAWNQIYPEMEIQLPEKIDIVKVKMEKLVLFEDLQDTEPEIYKRIEKGIFNSRVDKIAKKGISVIAIPRNVTEIPSWIMPYIDYETIVNDNIKRFYSVLESLGIQTIKASDKNYFTNILEV